MNITVIIMLLISATVAQVVADVSTAASPLYTYGPMGIILSWFMWISSKFVGAVKTDNAELRTELRGLGHKIEKMAKAMLIDVTSRDASGVHSKAQARELLEEMKAESR